MGTANVDRKSPRLPAKAIGSPSGADDLARVGALESAIAGSIPGAQAGPLRGGPRPAPRPRSKFADFTPPAAEPLARLLKTRPICGQVFRKGKVQAGRDGGQCRPVQGRGVTNRQPHRQYQVGSLCPPSSLQDFPALFERNLCLTASRISLWIPLHDTHASSAVSICASRRFSNLAHLGRCHGSRHPDCDGCAQ